MTETRIFSTARVDAVTKDLEDAMCRYKLTVAKLYELGGELDEMWDGEAADKFMAILGADRVKFEALSVFLAKFIEALGIDATRSR